MPLAYEYSSKEIDLFKALGLFEILKNPNVPPVTAYITAGYTAFIQYEQLPTCVRDSLKRCIIALENPGITPRLTQLFDDLIIL